MDTRVTIYSMYSGKQWGEWLECHVGLVNFIDGAVVLEYSGELKEINMIFPFLTAYGTACCRAYYNASNNTIGLNATWSDGETKVVGNADIGMMIFGQR